MSIAGRLAASSARLLTDGACRSTVTGPAEMAAIGARLPTPSATDTALSVSPAEAPFAQPSTDTCQLRPPPVIAPTVHPSPVAVSAELASEANDSSELTEKTCDAELLGPAGAVTVTVGALRSNVTVGDTAAAIGPAVPPSTESAINVSVRLPSEQPDTVTA